MPTSLMKFDDAHRSLMPASSDFFQETGEGEKFRTVRQYWPGGCNSPIRLII